MSDYINIGSTPVDEDCLPAGHPQSLAETHVYARQIRREFPAGRFCVKAFPHDFGTYYEVVAKWDTEGSPEHATAFEAEAEASPVWDDEARRELAEAGITLVTIGDAS